ESLRSVARAERFGHTPVALHGMNAIRVGNPNILCVSVTAAFAGAGETDDAPGSGGQAHQTSTEQALQINHEVEAPAAQFRDERGRIARRVPDALFEGTPVKGERVRQIRMPG